MKEEPKSTPMSDYQKLIKQPDSVLKEKYGQGIPPMVYMSAETKAKLDKAMQTGQRRSRHWYWRLWWKIESLWDR